MFIFIIKTFVKFVEVVSFSNPLWNNCKYSFFYTSEVLFLASADNAIVKASIPDLPFSYSLIDNISSAHLFSFPSF